MARFVLFLLASTLPIALGVAAVLGLERFAHLDQASAVGMAVAIVLALHIFQTTARRARDQRVFRRRMVDLDTLAGNWSGSLSAFSARLTSLEQRLPTDSAGDLKRVTAEVQHLAALAGRLSASIAGIEGRIAEGTSLPSKIHVLRPRSAPSAGPAEERSGPALLPDQITEATRRAVAEKRIEVFLQPIVTLPQRRPRYYEALVRLRGTDDALILPTDFIPAASRAGLLPRVDNLVLFQAVRILRRISARQGEIGLFCNISPQSLADGDFFGEFVGFAHANRSLADRLVFEMSQEAVASLGAIELESLGTLAGMGYRFSMDAVTQPGDNFEKLAERGFRFVKIGAQSVIDRSRRSHAPGDFVDMLARFGIDLIADRIETEQNVIDLLDCDVRLGQGYLFAPPRPVRADVLAASGEGADMAAAI